jgi:hypothetical protein
MIMAENKHLKMTGFWDVPETFKAKTKSLIPAPQSEKAPQDQKKIAEWLRIGCLVGSIIPQETAKKE